MKKNALPILIVLMTSSMVLKAQVGINTTTPASTLDVIAKNATGTTTNVDGLLVPRVDRQRAQSMTSVPTSTLIYVNSIATGTQAGTTINVDAIGYYYYDGTAWIKLNPTVSSVNIYNSNGTLTGNRTVTTGTNFLRFQNGTSVVGISNTATEGRLTATGSSRGSLGLVAGTSNLDIYQDGASIANINTSGASTGMNIATLNATPISFATNNTNRMTVTSAGNVGIGTSTPSAQLQTTGNMILGTAASTSGGTNYSSLVRDNATGELKVATSSTGNTTPINYITYTLSNVNGDWVNDYDTKINNTDYTVVVTGSSFTSSTNALTSAGGDFNPLNVYAYKSGSSWHLYADYVNAGAGAGVNGTWTFYCLVINNAIVKSLAGVSQNLGGSNSGAAASAPAGL